MWCTSTQPVQLSLMLTLLAYEVKYLLSIAAASPESLTEEGKYLKVHNTTRLVA